MIETANSGTSEGVRKSWEHRTRGSALAHLKELRKQGFRGRASVEKDPRDNTFFVRREEGELSERKPAEELTPYDKDIRRMKKFGTQDMHGALTDIIFSDKAAREEYEGDQPGANWEDAAADLATNYLSMHRAAQRNYGNENIMKASERMSELVAAEMKSAKVGYDQAWANVKATAEGKETIAANAGTSEGAKKGWEDRLSGIHSQLVKLHQSMGDIEWGPKHVNDMKTGEHWNALNNHLDNAVGRASTLLQHAKRVAK